MKKLLIICGPTATGKTALALRLAKIYNGELVNADSRQIYKGLDTLTGKDRSEDVAIHLYDVVDVIDEFSVTHFVRLANKAIDDIHARGKLPIIVGGTGFYLRALTEEIETLFIPPNVALRKHLDMLSVERLKEQLKKVDMHRFTGMNESDRKNPRRLIRAIEVAGNTAPQRSPKYDSLWIGLTAALPILKQRIAKRISDRFSTAVGEVRDGLPPILGADALISYKRGEMTKEESITKWIQAEYRYARRQITWFKKVKQIHWFDVSAKFTDEVVAFVREWYTQSI